MILTIAVVYLRYRDSYTVPQLLFLSGNSASLSSCVFAGISIAAYELCKLKLFIKQWNFFLYSKLQCNGIFLYLESS